MSFEGPDLSWPNYFFLLLAFCVSAEAATDFAIFEAFGSRMILAALAATALLVVSFALFVCVRAEAATAFSALLAVLLINTFAAVEETFLLVTSGFDFFAIFAIGFIPCLWPREARPPTGVISGIRRLR